MLMGDQQRHQPGNLRLSNFLHGHGGGRTGSMREIPGGVAHMIRTAAAVLMCVACASIAQANVGPAPVMSCPAADKVKFRNGTYRAPETLPGWRGSWTSVSGFKGKVLQLDSVLAYVEPDTAATRLINCTYRVEGRTKEDGLIDLSYGPARLQSEMGNLYVRLERLEDWAAGDDATGEDFLECAAENTCRFIPLQFGRGR